MKEYMVIVEMNDEQIIWLYNKVLSIVKNNLLLVIGFGILLIISLIFLIIRSINFDRRLLAIEKLIRSSIHIEIKEESKNELS